MPFCRIAWPPPARSHRLLSAGAVSDPSSIACRCAPSLIKQAFRTGIVTHHDRSTRLDDTGAISRVLVVCMRLDTFVGVTHSWEPIWKTVILWSADIVSKACDAKSNRREPTHFTFARHIRKVHSKWQVLQEREWVGQHGLRRVAPCARRPYRRNDDRPHGRLPA